MLRWLRELLSRSSESGPAQGSERKEAPDAEAAPDDDAPSDGRSPSSGDVVALPIEDSIDLHTFAPRDVASVVEEYVREARRHGFREVRIIHGRGKGVQRRIVQGVLSRHADVEGFHDAPASRGGWGATLAVLKPRR